MTKKSLKQRATQQRKQAKGWHSGKRVDAVSFEGGQYAGGRKEGRKNLKKLDSGNLLNQHGVEFTQADKKRLESLVNSANRKRTKMLKEEAKLPLKVGGRDTGINVGHLQTMGKESDFILARKTKSLQRFTTREQYESYIRNLERVNSPTYIDDRTRQYKRNHMKALENVFGDEAKDIIMKIRMMKPEEYRRVVQSDESLEVTYIYDPSMRSAKLNEIRSALGMKHKEEEYEEIE